MDRNDRSTIEDGDAEHALVDDVLPNAPVPYTAIEALHCEYDMRSRQIHQVAALFEGDLQGVVHYFVHGNSITTGREGYSSYMAEQVFGLDGAVAALNASFWGRALALTDVYDCMPNDRRTQWSEAIRGLTTPPFTRENVEETLTDLINRRELFIAEKIDGVFQNLARSKVTNRPEGFGTRMILEGVTNCMYNSDVMQGYIHDLRSVISRFMGCAEPDSRSTRRIIAAIARTPGEWFPIDGGAFRLKLFKNGNAHIETNPDLAWRLNAMLAMLYPAAIPSQHRSRPSRPHRDFGPMERVLPTEVRAALSELTDVRGSPVQKFVGSPHARQVRYGTQMTAQVLGELENVLALIGGVRRFEQGTVWFEFDYDPGAAINHVIVTGRVPDEKASQFYPTPPSLAREVIKLAEIEAGHACLEPSAGQGGLAKFMPVDQLTCVEINPLNVRVLREQGFNTHEADFLAWAASSTARFDRIAMNPPFSQGRALRHLECAAQLLKPGGRLVAIVPGSMRGTNPVPTLAGICEGLYSDLFQGTSASVSIYVGNRLQA